MPVGSLCPGGASHYQGVPQGRAALFLLRVFTIIFAQVVLLTIEEYLRVGQQGILENDDFHHTPLTTHILDITVKGKTNPNEGWTIFKKKDTMEEETIPREA